MPGNFNYLGLVALMLPGAKIIYCARDPRDIGLSIFTFRFYGYHPYAHDLADLGWYIAQHERLMAHWRAVLPNPMMTVRLEDWVGDFCGTLRRVLEFLDLPYDPACERFYEQDSRVRTVSRVQVRQPVNARGLGRWRPLRAAAAAADRRTDRRGHSSAGLKISPARAAQESSALAPPSVYISPGNVESHLAMALSLKDPETDRLAREVAQLTGESLTEAVRKALAERLERERLRRGKPVRRLAEELDALAKECAALPDLDTLSPDEILGFDGDGLWN
jgi:hypothetical protein